MSQFDVHKRRGTNDSPLFLDIQSDLIEALGTRVVIPLYPVRRHQRSIEQLTPVVKISGKRYLMAVPELAGIPTNVLGEKVTNLSKDRSAILAALDLLITGI